ncbi:hypothetical protein HYV11_02235 [Candidatus Dependentiae bacterium]|nr:hypothetical protein [Candidatus Dependentiae bacterium]
MKFFFLISFFLLFTTFSSFLHAPLDAPHETANDLQTRHETEKQELEKKQNKEKEELGEKLEQANNEWQEEDTKMKAFKEALKKNQTEVEKDPNNTPKIILKGDTYSKLNKLTTEKESLLKQLEKQESRHQQEKNTLAEKQDQEIEKFEKELSAKLTDSLTQDTLSTTKMTKEQIAQELSSFSKNISKKITELETERQDLEKINEENKNTINALENKKDKTTDEIAELRSKRMKRTAIAAKKRKLSEQIKLYNTRAENLTTLQSIIPDISQLTDLSNRTLFTKETVSTMRSTFDKIKNVIDNNTILDPFQKQRLFTQLSKIEKGLKEHESAFKEKDIFDHLKDFWNNFLEVFKNIAKQWNQKSEPQSHPKPQDNDNAYDFANIEEN